MFRGKKLALLGALALTTIATVVVLSNQPLQAEKKTDKPSWYVKKATWQETMLASRRKLIEALENDKAVAPLELGSWYQTRTFRRVPFGKRFFPETKPVDFSAKGRNGKRLWTKRNFLDSKVHRFAMPGKSVVYFARKIYAKRDIVQQAYFGSDDSLAVFLNGKRLINNKTGRGVAANQDSCKLHLKKGENILVMKIHNGGGAAGMYFSIYPNPGMDKEQSLMFKLWDALADDFYTVENSRKMGWEKADNIWTVSNVQSYKSLATAYAKNLTGKIAKKALKLAADAKDEASLNKVRELYYDVRSAEMIAANIKNVNVKALKRAIEDMLEQYEDEYKNGKQYLKEVTELGKEYNSILAGLSQGDKEAIKKAGRLIELNRKALLANPAIDFEKILLVKHRGGAGFLPANWHGNCALPRVGHDSTIDTLDLKTGRMELVYQPKDPSIILDLDLEYDAKKMIFSSIAAKDKKWHIFEVGADGKNLRQITPTSEIPIDNYDPVYLPDGKIIFESTRCFAGVPCVAGNKQVANSFVMNADGTGVRQLTFEQDHNWNPTVMPESGKVMYTRWEYTDSAHYFTRILMTMNPDGTNQQSYYGTNSFWPNSMFYTRPIPGKPSQFVTIVSGHHGTKKSGRLILFDVEKGRRETAGVIHEIPFSGRKVKPTIKDKLVDGVWPQFLNPYPINDKFFLVACKKSPKHKWGIYLVDTFDNMLKLKELPNANLGEPIPLRKTKRPPKIRSKVNVKAKDASAYIVDIYQGPGLKGIPRGKVKKLRLFAWHYSYTKMGGHMNVAIEGGWEPKRILGTVPVEKDGSAHFKIPANTPIAIQPLDENGRALQIMRSWFVAMPGERISCVGCHESQSDGTPTPKTIALYRKPSPITPWKGPVRGLSFERDIQQVLDKYCVSCHSGMNPNIPNFKDVSRRRNWTESYIQLHPYVRRPGPESDYHLLNPMEYHPSTSELVQMLQKGHHGVKLDRDSWDRLYTWIDMNVPCFGTWGEAYAKARRNPALDRERKNAIKYRAQMLKKYAFIDKKNDPEAITTRRPKVTPVAPGAMPERPETVTTSNWPLTPAQAKAAQKKLGKIQQTFDLGNGVKLVMVKIPAGKFVMGDVNGFQDEWKQTVVEIKKPFWMGKFEITNKQYNQFDPKHDSRYIDQQWKDHTRPGYEANKPNQPVIRVSWLQAMEFCNWLSKKTGKKFTLPTEAQWEYAARAGSDKAFWFGDVNANYAKYANLGDYSLIRMAVTGVDPKPRRNPDFYLDFLPRDKKVNDRNMLAVEVGKYLPNPWGLYNMVGNVCEWTRSDYKPYPYNAKDGRNDLSKTAQKVLRGGSWRDRAKWSRASIRRNYQPYQKVFNGGFRVIMEE